MYDRILLATDFSDCSQAARQQACALAERFGGELHLVHVLPDPLLLAPEPGFALPVPSEYLLQLEADARRALDGVVTREWASGRIVVRQIRHGNPANEIVRYADEQRINLIVVGTHGRGALGHLLMGSIAERVVRLAGCPVLTVGQKVAAAIGAPSVVAAKSETATAAAAPAPPVAKAATVDPAAPAAPAACGPTPCGPTPCGSAAGSQGNGSEVAVIPAAGSQLSGSQAAAAAATGGATPGTRSTETAKPAERERKAVKAGK
jgi:nucleotide-binding universal stress UspA family protein